VAQANQKPGFFNQGRCCPAGPLRRCSNEVGKTGLRGLDGWKNERTISIIHQTFPFPSEDGKL